MTAHRHTLADRRDDCYEAPPISKGGDEYEGLSTTFVAACRKADAQAAKPRPGNVVDFPTVQEAGVPSAATLQAEYEALLRCRREHRLAKSVLDVADWLAHYNPERLRTWLLERPEWERTALVAYLRGKQR
jgi:hypothetical protein